MESVFTKLRGKLREKQEGNTLRDVTFLYCFDFQLFKTYFLFDVFDFYSKFDFKPNKIKVSL